MFVTSQLEWVVLMLSCKLTHLCSLGIKVKEDMFLALAGLLKPTQSRIVASLCKTFEGRQ